MKWIDRMLVGVLAAGLWTGIALYVFAPNSVGASHDSPFPRNSGDLTEFIWEVVEVDCVAMDDGDIYCDY
jgi:hypothetical protein